MTLHLLACRAAVVALCAAAGTSHATNLLANGSFENLAGTWVEDPGGVGFMSVTPNVPGIVPGWVVSSLRPVAWARDGNPYGVSASDGSYHIDLTGPLDGPVFDEISTTFNTVVGARYRLSFDLGVNNGPCGGVVCSGPVGVNVTIVSVPLPAFGNINPTGAGQQWTHFSVDFTAAELRSELRFEGIQGVAYIGLDNVVVEAVPEPASLLLMAGGVAGLVARRRSVPAARGDRS